MTKLTKEQMLALKRVYDREIENKLPTYLAFRRTAFKSYLLGCVMVPWCGMWLGIEEDGYTHS